MLKGTLLRISEYIWTIFKYSHFATSNFPFLSQYYYFFQANYWFTILYSQGQIKTHAALDISIKTLLSLFKPQV